MAPGVYTMFNRILHTRHVEQQPIYLLNYSTQFVLPATSPQVIARRQCFGTRKISRLSTQPNNSLFALSASFLGKALFRHPWDPLPWPTL